MKLSGYGRQIVLEIDDVSANWNTPNSGKLCVDTGNVTSVTLGAASLEVMLDNSRNITVVELHDVSYHVNAAGKAAVRCGGSLTADNPSDPVGNYNWTVLGIQ